MSFLKFLTSFSKLLTLAGSSKKTSRTRRPARTSGPTRTSGPARRRNPLRGRAASNAEFFIYKLEIMHSENNIPFEAKKIVWLIAPESKAYKKAREEYQRRKEYDEVSIPFRSNKQVDACFNDNIASFVARCVIDWENIELNGELLVFNYKNAKMVFKQNHWLRDQVIDYYKHIEEQSP
jgi:hypothetical protein